MLSPQQAASQPALSTPGRARGVGLAAVSTAMESSPLAVSGSPRWWPGLFPAGGHAGSPYAVMVLPACDQVRGFTPFPLVASVSRNESPWVTTMWAWCRSRSTVAVARVLGISSSRPEGCRLELTARERRS
jgi:hypothetical protein